MVAGGRNVRRTNVRRDYDVFIALTFTFLLKTLVPYCNVGFVEASLIARNRNRKREEKQFFPLFVLVLSHNFIDETSEGNISP